MPLQKGREVDFQQVAGLKQGLTGLEKALTSSWSKADEGYLHGSLDVFRRMKLLTP